MEIQKDEFQRTELFEGNVSVLLPKDFRDMPDDIARKKYAAKSRPPVIMMSEDTLVNYTFALLEVPLPESELENAARGFYKNLKSLQARGNFGEVQLDDRQDGQFAWFEYDGQAMDADLFYVVYVTNLKGKFMYGSFNCLLQDKEKWKEKALYSIRSIHETGGKHV